MNSFPLSSCGLNNHSRPAEAFPLSWDPRLTGNYSSACLITMEIDFIQRAQSTQNHDCTAPRIPTSEPLLLLPASFPKARPPGDPGEQVASPSAWLRPCSAPASCEATLNLRGLRGGYTCDHGGTHCHLGRLLAALEKEAGFKAGKVTSCSVHDV